MKWEEGSQGQPAMLSLLRFGSCCSGPSQAPVFPLHTQEPTHLNRTPRVPCIIAMLGVWDLLEGG